ncbi:uncharacterized protein LOC132564341 [Ylistrum balloti]|uniref:uncharacterized protein LOC132564341 n=1 Tax=Ylistrum balloti TaxID=509963 RepID=UPI0029058249|nr:uncharacterized protein LOC132564341 [Ylistrum balloti]
MSVDSQPVQRSLGLSWNLAGDFFTFNSHLEDKPYTRRGILATINGLYDPLGFAAPVVLKGKLLFRDLISSTLGWDDPLPEDSRRDWELWKRSLKELNYCKVRRSYCEVRLHQGMKQCLHVFCDASKDAIAAVAYFKITEDDGNSHVCFVLGKAKVAPHHGHTIPRLELCSAVLATELGQIIADQLDVNPADIRYHSDSNVVLGYINNRVRRFYTYVANRIDRILNVSKPTQWQHVPTNMNPADIGTRCIDAGQLDQSPWLRGPSLLLDCEILCNQDFPLISPQTDAEVRNVVALKSSTSNSHDSLGTERFQRFSGWTSLTRAIGNLLWFVQHFKTKEGSFDSKEGSAGTGKLSNLERAKRVILRETQKEAFPKEIRNLQNSKPIPKDSHISSLSPYLDEEGILRVGGRLNKSGYNSLEKNPVILPGKHHTAKLIVLHFQGSSPRSTLHCRRCPLRRFLDHRVQEANLISHP